MVCDGVYGQAGLYSVVWLIGEHTKARQSHKSKWRGMMHRCRCDQNTAIARWPTHQAPVDCAHRPERDELQRININHNYLACSESNE